MASRPTAPPTRDLSIDNLRTLAVLLLIPFHVLALWSFLPYGLHEPQLYPEAHRAMQVIHIWHMPLLFLLAGASATAGLAKRGVRRFLRERLQRLGVPLLFGMVVLVPPMVYFERITPWIPNRWSPIDFDGSFFAFYPHFFECCYPEANLSYHHLWFLNFLLVFSFLLWPVWRWMSGPGAARLAERLMPRPEAAWRLLPLGFLLVLSEVALNPISNYTFKFYEDWARDGNYMLSLLAGAWLFSQPRLWAAVSRIAWLSAVLAIAFIVALFLLDPSEGLSVPIEWPFAPWYMHALWGAAEWTSLLAILGLGRRFLNQRIPLITSFAPLSMSFYVLHMTVIFVFAYLLLDWQPGFWAKFLALMALATVFTYVLCRLFDLTPVTRYLVGSQALGVGPRSRPGTGRDGVAQQQQAES